MQQPGRIDLQGYIKDAWQEMLQKAPDARVSENDHRTNAETRAEADVRGWVHIYKRGSTGWLSLVAPEVALLFPSLEQRYASREAGCITVRQAFPFVINTIPEFPKNSTQKTAYFAQPLLIGLRNEHNLPEVGLGFEIHEAKRQNSRSISQRRGLVALTVGGEFRNDLSFIHATTRAAGNITSLLNVESINTQQAVEDIDIDQALLVVDGFTAALSEL